MWQPGWEGMLGENGTCVCVAASLCSPETVTTLFVNQLYPCAKLKAKKERNIHLVIFELILTLSEIYKCNCHMCCFH